MELYHLDLHEVRELYLRAKLAGDSIDQDLREGLKNAAQPAVDQVRADATWSSRIPAATRVWLNLAGKRPWIKVVVSSTAAPEARPLNNGGSSGFFRHPVFANQDLTRREWTWVPQRGRPFFHPERSPAMEAEVDKVLDLVEFRLGFK